jgi:acyl-CoA reductase-like NAD-dependent aldehyde dehydrogenase
LQFIDGRWRPGSADRALRVRDPYTRQVISEIQLASVRDVDTAYRAAAAAQPAWANTPPAQRRVVLDRAVQWVDRHHRGLVELIVRELGGTRLRAAYELRFVTEFLRSAAALTERPIGQLLPSPDPDKENRLYLDPVGAVSVISPFNVPLFLSIKAVAPALALGNAVVLKPHELAPLTGGAVLARMFLDAGLPPGLLNVVITDLVEIGDAFLEHPVPQVIAFTGSAPTGRHIAEVAGRHLKKVVLELGGNSALIVLDDADLELAVNAAVFSRFTHAGQVCMSANRLVLDERICDQFLDRYVARVAALPVGDPRDDATVIGPLISPQHAERLDRQVQQALEHGAVAALEPKPRDPDSGLYAPVVLTDVTIDNPVSQTELFGPVVCVMTATDEPDAIRIANATPYGLSGAVHTQDLTRGARVARQVRTGMIHVNNATIHDEPAVPFGGVGASGYGRLNGDATLHAFTQPTWVSVHHGNPLFPY